MSDEPTYDELYRELESVEGRYAASVAAVAAVSAQSAQQAATIADLETTIDGLADLNRDLERDLGVAREEIGRLQSAGHRTLAALSDAASVLRRADNELVVTLQGDD
ncbi:Hypothetical protein AJAP_27885 [Amycolatopsis japonica]|uniref:Uncharacterized protein n=1 Tax=Amycolatopsis japonica TaxID=208439 RepID=A0A075V174_9PSEU|nr:hypothetical protein [Amycolatopsis japonica]AIG78421.1 Hypothetical protein AJAP_27885 [Amycolatopsis japonica]